MHKHHQANLPKQNVYYFFFFFKADKQCYRQKHDKQTNGHALRLPGYVVDKYVFSLPYDGDYYVLGFLDLPAAFDIIDITNTIRPS